jgi:SAM-dependent methyltransferase
MRTVSEAAVIRYGTSRRGFADRAEVIRALAREADRICEVGAGANPLLDARPGYTLLDISEDELAKVGPGYDTAVADVCSPSFDPPGEFDLVFSLSTAEHVRDPRRFHENVRRLLRPGGLAVHHFPTLYALPFVVNRLLPQGVSERLLTTIDPRRGAEGNHGKFPAYYRWCRGPSRRQADRFAECGFVVEEYRGYFGHRYLERAGIPTPNVWPRLMLRYPLPLATSFALVILRAV